MPGRQPSEVHGVNSRLGSCGAHRSSVGESGIPQIAANRLLVKHRAALGSSLRYFRVHAPEKLQRSMADLLAWYGGGRLKPLISARYPLERAVEALKSLTDRRAIGKVVVCVAGDHTRQTSGSK